MAKYTTDWNDNFLVKIILPIFSESINEQYGFP